MNVKCFWGEFYYYFLKFEMDDVGGIFVELEVCYKDVYLFLFEKLGLNEMFS